MICAYEFMWLDNIVYPDEQIVADIIKAIVEYSVRGSRNMINV